MKLLDMLPLSAPVLQCGRDTGLNRHIHLSRPHTLNPHHVVPTTYARHGEYMSGFTGI
jgi:hypothetical protein